MKAITTSKITERIRLKKNAKVLRLQRQHTKYNKVSSDHNDDNSDKKNEDINRLQKFESNLSQMQ
jgi:hypothetical protein